MILTRYESTSDGTFGILRVNNEIFHTVENPWINNQPFKSCVPSGDYSLVPHTSEKYGQVLCMVNEPRMITHWQETYSKRYACLIHVANYSKDVQGCIGLGKRRHENMVTHSKIAISDFYHLINPNEIHKLTIEWGEK